TLTFILLILLLCVLYRLFIFFSTSLFLSCYVYRRVLHSFPTRRSSDLRLLPQSKLLLVVIIDSFARVSACIRTIAETLLEFLVQRRDDIVAKDQGEADVICGEPVKKCGTFTAR